MTLELTIEEMETIRSVLIKIQEITAKPAWPYYFNGEWFIVSDDPGAAEAIKQHPEFPVKSLAELELLQ